MNEVIRRACPPRQSQHSMSTGENPYTTSSLVFPAAVFFDDLMCDARKPRKKGRAVQESTLVGICATTVRVSRVFVYVLPRNHANESPPEYRTRLQSPKTLRPCGIKVSASLHADNLPWSVVFGRKPRSVIVAQFRAATCCYRKGMDVRQDAFPIYHIWKCITR